MTRVAVLLADGFEEIEALAPVDVLRRAGLEVDILGVTGLEVTSAHDIIVKADKAFSGNLEEYDLAIIPGGLPGATNLRDNDAVIESIKALYDRGAKLAAICAGPIVLAKAGLMKDRSYVCYPGFEDDIPEGKLESQAITVQNGHILTARGPGAALEFSLAILDWIGEDAQAIEKDMQYDLVKDHHKAS